MIERVKGVWVRHFIVAVLCVVSAAAVWLPGSQVEAQSGKWEVITREAGVVVSTRAVDHYDLPIIRGVGVIKANLYEVLAVLADVGRNKEWMHSCRDSKLLRLVNDYERIIYNRTAVPWPADDRDAVVHSKITSNPDKKTVLIAFRSIKSPLMKEVDGVVRMPVLKGFYLLQKLDEERTRVTYQAEADVGGMLPDWLVEMNSKDIPLQTIVSLRKQVAKTKGRYPAFIKKWDPRVGGQGF